jgi:alkylation response protein AidB-like acyl-CoA dehydrogenase
VWDAARALDEAAEKNWDNNQTAYEFAAAVAATLAPVAAQHCAQDCIQVHGGIGFTWEHPAHLYLRRARTDAQIFGDSNWHRERYVRLREENS